MTDAEPTDGPLAFDAIAAASSRIGATRARNEKVAVLAEVLGRCTAREIGPAAALLAGEPRQGKVGVGWSTLRSVHERLAGRPDATGPTVTVVDVDELLTQLLHTAGPGSTIRRIELVGDVMARMAPAARDVLGSILLGDPGHGALESLVADAVAVTLGVPKTVVRRALMLQGDLAMTAAIGAVEGRPGLEAIGLRVGRAVQPMLAATAGDVAEALAATGPASVEQKLDGARIQAHRTADGEVTLYTRNLNDITDRLPEAAAVVAGLPGGAVVLDGEVLGLDADGRPRAFQDTMSGIGDGPGGDGGGMRPFFFDILHRDGNDLIDLPLADRLGHLEAVVGPHRIHSIVTDDPATAERFADDTLAAGHEGVMVKDLTTTYDAGRRGKGWRKVKPVHTLDLVVLGAEWGHGRRTGSLSNLHLGARDPDDPARFVMVGKTFKGLTDELLAWQTEQLLTRALDSTQRTPDDGWVVMVRPELVVEIAVDGVQRSTRYPGGVALRFARVKGYRPDRSADTADTIDTVRSVGRPN